MTPLEENSRIQEKRGLSARVMPVRFKRLHYGLVKIPSLNKQIDQLNHLKLDPMHPFCN
ncbi:hypothetical protein NKH23_08360 [Mesorhizobium sp. M1328]|uniref:hypothetical protein n=1 Tax=Mesorhizobium sp. M1328 TaxID=2957082 RepID=UPI003337522D